MIETRADMVLAALAREAALKLLLAGFLSGLARGSGRGARARLKASSSAWRARSRRP